MSAPVIVWLTVGLVTVAALIAVLVGLVRHLLLLFRTAAQFQREVQPVADEISSNVARASSRGARLRDQAPSGGRGGSGR